MTGNHKWFIIIDSFIFVLVNWYSVFKKAKYMQKMNLIGWKFKKPQ
jgi:hypothetical protein